MTDPSNKSIQDRLRATLETAAPDDTGVDDFLGTLRDRIDGAEPGGTGHRIDTAKRRGGPNHPRILVAAAVFAAAVIGAAVLVTRDESPSMVIVGGPDSTTPVAPAPADATGLYVPEGLPAGWSLEAVTTDFLDADKAACPCPSTTWLSPDETKAIVVNSWVATAPLDGQLFDGTSWPIVLGGVPGWAGSMGTTMSQTIMFDTGGRRWAVTATDNAGNREGVGDDAVRAAMRVLADPEAAPADGFEKYESYTRRGGVKSFRSVSVELRTPAGHRLVYSLYPSGFTDNLAVYRVPQRYRVEGQVAPASRFEWPAIDPSPSYTQIVGRWPGADVVVNDDSPAGNAADGRATSDEIIEVMSRLQSVSSDEWSDFVVTVLNSGGTIEDIGPGALDLARVDDLLARPGREEGTTVEAYGAKFRIEIAGKTVRIERWQPAEGEFVSAGETTTNSISIYTVPSKPAVGLVIVPTSFKVSLPAGSTLEMGNTAGAGGMTCAVIRFTSKRPEENTLTLTSSDSTETITVPAPNAGNAGVLTRPA